MRYYCPICKQKQEFGEKGNGRKGGGCYVEWVWCKGCQTMFRQYPSLPAKKEETNND